MRKATLALLAGLGLAAMAGAAQAAGDGGCAWQRTVQKQSVDASSTQADAPAPAAQTAG